MTPKVVDARARAHKVVDARARRKKCPKTAPTPQNPKMENLTYDYSGPHMARRVNAALKKKIKKVRIFFKYRIIKLTQSSQIHSSRPRTSPNGR